MSRTTHGFLPIFLRPLMVFLLAVCLFTGCIASPTTDEEPAKPGVEVSATLLDFSKSLESLSFTVTLTGGVTEWKLAGDLPEWCGISEERTAGGGTVMVTVDRSSLEPGEYAASVTVKWADGNHIVKIRVVVPDAVGGTGTIVIDTPLPEIEEITR